jgi:hypothetical protein
MDPIGDELLAIAKDLDLVCLVAGLVARQCERS